MTVAFFFSVGSYSETVSNFTLHASALLRVFSGRQTATLGSVLLPLQDFLDTRYTAYRLSMIYCLPVYVLLHSSRNICVLLGLFGAPFEPQHVLRIGSTCKQSSGFCRPKQQRPVNSFSINASQLPPFSGLSRRPLKQTRVHARGAGERRIAPSLPSVAPLILLTAACLNGSPEEK